LRRRMSAVKQKKGEKWGGAWGTGLRDGQRLAMGMGMEGPPPVAGLRPDNQPCGTDPVGARALPALVAWATK